MPCYCIAGSNRNNTQLPRVSVLACPSSRVLRPGIKSDLSSSCFIIKKNLPTDFNPPRHEVQSEVLMLCPVFTLPSCTHTCVLALIKPSDNTTRVSLQCSVTYWESLVVVYYPAAVLIKGPSYGGKWRGAATARGWGQGAGNHASAKRCRFHTRIQGRGW